MYTPPAFAVADEAEAAAMLTGARLGCLVTHGPEGLFASHLPFIHDAVQGLLTGHLAKANPHRTLAGDSEALVVFTGVEAYVSPGFYPSKAEHGRVVPTWNYEVVHVHGRLHWFDDAGRLRQVVEALTSRFEADRPEPWSVDDAPEPYVAGQLKGIVGLELRIDRMLAKRKLSQNRGEADRLGVEQGLAVGRGPNDQAVAAAMARLRWPS